MDSFAVLEQEYYFRIDEELTYTDYAMYQNAIVSGFQAAIVRLVTALISTRVLMITVMSRMCFVLHTVIRTSAEEYSNALITV